MPWGLNEWYGHTEGGQAAAEDMGHVKTFH